MDDAGTRTPSGAGSNRVVHAPFGTKGLADLADGAVGAEGLPHRREQIRVPLGRLDDGRERRGCRLGVPFGPHARGPLELAALGRRVDPLQLGLGVVVLGEAVDADDHALAALDLALPLERGLLDLVLDEAGLDRRDRAAELVDALDQLPGTRPRARPSATR